MTKDEQRGYDAATAELLAYKTRVEAMLGAAEQMKDVLTDAQEMGVFGLQDRSGISLPEDWVVKDLGEQIGFGALMDAASRMWANVFSCGPCVAVRRRWLEDAANAVEAFKETTHDLDTR